MNDIEISRYGNLLVYKKGYTPEYVFEIIKSRKLNGLRIFAQLRDQRLDNIDFLENYTFLESLDISSIDDFDFTSLTKLENLKELSIFTEGEE